MQKIEHEGNKSFSQLDLRAINDLLYLLNRNFLHIDTDSNCEDGSLNFMNYFSELDFSRMSEPLKALESIKAIKNLKPEVKKFIFVRLLNASHEMLFWKTEREIIAYLLNFKFIGAKEMMMLNCSYILRNLLPYNGYKCEFASRGSYDYEMWITNEEDFHCNIYINTGCDSRGDFVNIFIDYHTILRNMQRHLPPFSFAIEEKLYLISKAIDENNCFNSSKNYFFSYKKDSPSVDEMNHGVWFRFYDIQFQ